MRTLQEKYNAIQEGNFSKDQFLRDARLEQPNLVTRFNGYDDAVQILKNRGMISEGFANHNHHSEFGTPTGTGKEDDTDYLADLAAQSDTFEEFVQGLAKVLGPSKTNYRGWRPTWNKLKGRNKQSLHEAVNMTLEPGDVFRNVSSKVMLKPNHNYEIISANEFVIRFKDQDYPKQTGTVQLNKFNELVEKGDIIVFPKKTTSFSKELNEANQLKTTKKGLTDYRYKPTNDMDKYPYEQILRGLRVELEGLQVLGTPTPEEYKKALAKVLKNLEKDSIFYTNQVAGVKAKAKRTDVMVDATPKNEVDKENGLQKAALKEAIKGVIKNILSEGNEFAEGEEVYEMYADSDGDYEHDKDTAVEAEKLYDAGQELYNQGKIKQAEVLRQQALKKGAWLGWNEADLPPYKTTHEIPGFEGTRDALDNLFESVSLKDLLD